jgi:hypothetical protein
MAKEILFDIDRVTTIEFIKESLTDKVWQDEMPAKTIYLFGFIPVGQELFIPAGWRSDEYEWNISTEEDLRQCFWYRLDMETKKVYNKAFVRVYLGYKESHTQTFDSDEEAADWVHEINELSGKNFVLITYK